MKFLHSLESQDLQIFGECKTLGSLRGHPFSVLRARFLGFFSANDDGYDRSNSSTKINVTPNNGPDINNEASTLKETFSCVILTLVSFLFHL